MELKIIYSKIFNKEELDLLLNTIIFVKILVLLKIKNLKVTHRIQIDFYFRVKEYFKLIGYVIINYIFYCIFLFFL
jgi:hypothetical protein